MDLSKLKIGDWVTYNGKISSECDRDFSYTSWLMRRILIPNANYPIDSINEQGISIYVPGYGELWIFDFSSFTPKDYGLKYNLK